MNGENVKGRKNGRIEEVGMSTAKVVKLDSETTEKTISCSSFSKG